MLVGYTRGHRGHPLQWTDELSTVFYTLRDSVASSPKLYFINEIWDIGLTTDASDYGIGACLFQVDPDSNTKLPIQFVSKLRWSTPKKEMYAKYYAVKKLEYVIDDRPFTWYTDHKHNTLIRSSGSDKVLRWDLYLQNFDITNVYIKGEDNEVSDSLSRLCAVSDSTEYLTMLEEYEVAKVPELYLNLLQERTPSDGELALLVQPRTLSSETYKTIANVHNSKVGHLGVERTMYKLQRLKHIWPQMKADIVTFIKRCPLCQKMSNLKIPIYTIPFTTASYGLYRLYRTFKGD
jgi:hypothetical protein